MFDSSTNIAWKVRKPDGERIVETRWPTDQEWIDRSRGVFILFQDLGRGKTKNDLDSTEADCKLYEKIRSPESPELAPEEAYAYIESLARTNVINVQLDQSQAHVEMIVCGNERVRHTLRIPTTVEERIWEKSSQVGLQMPHGKSRFRTNIQVGMDLWGKCLVETEGYKNGVPAIHQDTAIRAVIMACRQESEVAKEEDF